MLRDTLRSESKYWFVNVCARFHVRVFTTEGDGGALIMRERDEGRLEQTSALNPCPDTLLPNLGLHKC